MSGDYRFCTFCTRDLIQHHTVSTKEVNYLFPLYVHAPEEQVKLGLYQPDDTIPNLEPDYIAEWEETLGLTFVSHGGGDLKVTFGPEDVFGYIYAILHAPSYRDRYAEFFEDGFPCIPRITGLELLRLLVEKGSRLVELHLREAAPTPLPLAFPLAGSSRIARGYPRFKDNRIYINKKQCIEGVPTDVWDFHIGGAQVARKWLYERRGRVLGYDELTEYRLILAAIRETVSLQLEVDEVIEDAGSWPLR